MVDLKKVGSFLKKSLLITLAAGAVYYAGLKQNPSFQELTPKVQQVVIQEHNQLDSLLKSIGDDCSKGNFKGAITNLENSKILVNMLSKIDPRFKELNSKIDQYRQLIGIAETAISSINVNINIKNVSSNRLLDFVGGLKYEIDMRNIMAFSHEPHLSPEIKEVSLKVAQQLHKEKLKWINDLRSKISERKNRTSIPKEVQILGEALKIIDQEVIPDLTSKIQIIDHELR